MTPIEAMKQAESALDDAYGNINPERGFADELEREILSARTNLRAAIEQMEKAEPVAWLCKTHERIDLVMYQDQTFGEVTPLYTNPAPIPEAAKRDGMIEMREMIIDELGFTPCNCVKIIRKLEV